MIFGISISDRTVGPVKLPGAGAGAVEAFVHRIGEILCVRIGEISAIQLFQYQFVFSFGFVFYRLF